ncbi:helix-turn-helix transcriptional regulator [Hazenella sp. IB182357]|uniref:Helix-turn-helix transcriptional regulator n=1 Tax=Polycladospora coralii TaxID=2771432 RepID=A0A926RUN8_9BACL|nr:helix-turn-helix transcriptional regulator [Polycladospora coralii]MBD1372599.1 helix-turn-helix transcriptional regulator [Polycladospora coralii]MBS7531297.1 helix-turn-helix transcriptional regulator [Polycladospora coralii]
MEFSERLKQLREEKNWTQGDLAERLNIGRSTIGDYEYGRKLPRYERLKEIADVFNISVDYLLNRTNEKRSIEDLKKEIESTTPDLETIILRTKPLFRGKEITEEQARRANKVLEALFDEENKPS